jgi:hypothetical protein
MPIRPQRKIKSVGTKTAELAMAVPQVMAHRFTRLAMAGTRLSVRDRKEFERMVAEKNTAFTEAWQAMAKQSVRAHRALAVSVWQSLWLPSLRRKPSAGTLAAEFHRAALDIVGKGIAPVHRKALANARRLARTKLR